MGVSLNKKKKRRKEKLYSESALPPLLWFLGHNSCWAAGAATATAAAAAASFGIHLNPFHGQVKFGLLTGLNTRLVQLSLSVFFFVVITCFAFSSAAKLPNGFLHYNVRLIKTSQRTTTSRQQAAAAGSGSGNNKTLEKTVNCLLHFKLFIKVFGMVLQWVFYDLFLELHSRMKLINNARLQHRLNIFNAKKCPREKN